MMKKLFVFSLAISIISCNSIENHFRDRNLYVFKNDDKIVEIKKNKEEKLDKEKEIIEVKVEKIVKTEDKLDEKKEYGIRKGDMIIVNETKKDTVVEKKEIPIKKDYSLIRNGNPKKEENKKVEIKKEENKKVEIKKEEIKEIETKKKETIEEKVVKKETIVEVPISKENIIANEEKIKFTDVELQIIKFISTKVIENEEQIKKVLINSIDRLNKKGKKYTVTQFLAKANDIIKKTNINSFLLVNARVMNSLEK